MAIVEEGGGSGGGSTSYKYGYISNKSGYKDGLILGYNDNYFSINIDANGGTITSASSSTTGRYQLRASTLKAVNANGKCSLYVYVYIKIARTNYSISGWTKGDYDNSYIASTNYTPGSSGSDLGVLEIVINHFSGEENAIVHIKPTWKENQKTQLSTATNPKINSSSSVTVKYGTSYTISWTKIANASGYDIWTHGVASGTYGNDWSKHTGNVGNVSSKSGMGGWAASAIGNYYDYHVQPLPSNSSTHVSPDASYCGKVRVLVAGVITLYDVNGSVLSEWNGKLITSWSSGDVFYQPTNYNAVSWYDAQTDGNKITSYSTTDLRNKGGTVKLYARATKKQYTVTFNPNGGTCSPTSKSVNIGDSIQLNSIAITSKPTGKEFKGWSTNSASSGLITSTSYKPTGNTTLTAIWVDNYNITYDLNAPNSVLGSGKLPTSPATITGGEKVSGTSFQITTTVPTMIGHVFQHWQDDSGTTYPSGGTYEKNAGTTLKAIWTAKQYTPTVKAPDPGPNLPVFFGTWTFNTAPTLPSVPSGYDDSLWQPKNPFWKITAGSTITYVAAGATYAFGYDTTPTVQAQWRQITHWRKGQLWIYIPEEGGF